MFPQEHSPLGQECHLCILAFNPYIWQEMVYESRLPCDNATFSPFHRVAKFTTRANAHPANISMCYIERENMNLIFSFYKLSFLIFYLHVQKEDKNNFLPAGTTQDFLSVDTYKDPSSSTVANFQNCRCRTSQSVQLKQGCRSLWIIYI